jgi:hypothetical protein
MKKVLFNFALLVSLACFVLSGFAGDLDPPDEATDTNGQPVPTMKTLEEIFQAATPLPTGFVLWEDNRRFAVWDRKTPAESDDVVLDRATNLMWTRDLDHGTKHWEEAIEYCESLEVGDRFDWRLPKIEELITLTEPYLSIPPLPAGHPFVNVPTGSYWSSTRVEGSTSTARYVAYHGHVNVGSIGGVYMNVIPVRGGE